MAEPSYSKLTSMHFAAWKIGLKTGQYYLRTRPARDAIKFTVNVEALLKASEEGNNQELLKVLSNQTKDKKRKNPTEVVEDGVKKAAEVPAAEQKAAEEEEEDGFAGLACENCGS